MDPETKSVVFTLKQEYINWQLSDTYKSLIIYKNSMFPVMTNTSQKMVMERWTMHLPKKWK